MEITTKHVRSRTRQLSARWTLNDQGKYEISEEAKQRNIEDIMLRSFLQQHGTSVAFYEGYEEAFLWCELNVKKQWSTSRDDVISTPEMMNREMLLATGQADTNLSESMWAESINRMVERDMAELNGHILPKGYFWFEDRDEAMMFKLMWGGQ